MSFIKGNIRKIIYENLSNSYKVGIIKVKETDDNSIKEYIGHTIYFVGYFSTLTDEVDYTFYGNMTFNSKYGNQYKVDSYEIASPNSLEEMINYLGSGLFEGIGIKTAEKIVKKFGEETFNIIENEPSKLLLVNGLSSKKIDSLVEKFNSLTVDDKLIKDLTKLGFSVNESIKIIKNHKGDIKNIIQNNLYVLEDVVNFQKIDSIYLKYNDINSDIRIEYVIKYVIKDLCYRFGNTLVSKESVYIELLKYFNNDFPLKSFNLYLDLLIKDYKIYEFNEYIMLDYFHECEKKISESLYSFNKIKSNIKKKEVEDYINSFEELNNIKFNKDQKEAIIGSITNNLYVISGGPGTGKTTIIKAIVTFYENSNDIALLAPTGRSAKRMMESTDHPASTIHKFLKWDKENSKFGLNINNKSKAKIIIIDEFSMVDMFLFSSLIDALNVNVKIILVGDANQLPSIGPGNLLYDLLQSENIKKTYLDYIYRRNENSYINILADQIKNKKEIEMNEYSDFRVIESEDENIIEYLKQISIKLKSKNINLDEFQVLVPMYKGINGIDNINAILQDIFNPKGEKEEITFSNQTFREGDKVMNLVNDIENNVYNGDIGYIKSISSPQKKEIVVNYSGNIVTYDNENITDLTLAYAISIHKSQGSEYDNVLMILASSQKRMLYNKLVYTGVTRSKNGIVIIGKLQNLNEAIKSQDMLIRKTNLINML